MAEDFDTRQAEGTALGGLFTNVAHSTQHETATDTSGVSEVQQSVQRRGNQHKPVGEKQKYH